MAAFNRWHLTKVELDPCRRSGRVAAMLLLAPPHSWSQHQIPYRVRVMVQVDAVKGAPVVTPPENWKGLAKAVKRLTHWAERHEHVQRFIERFRLIQAEIGATGQSNKYQVTLIADPGLHGPAQGTPTLTYSEAVPGRISAYRIPRMDGLPARPELLRFLEVLSRYHPRCRPLFIDARHSPVTDSEEDVHYWKFQTDLEGKACPLSFAAQIGPHGAVTRTSQEDSLPSAVGENGAAQ